MMDIVHAMMIAFEQSCLYFPLVLGAYISISLMKLPDLSIEAAFLFGALVTARFMMLGLTLPSGIALIMLLLISVLGGMMVGLTSSLLNRYAKIPHLLASILTVGLFHGLSLLTLGSSMVSLSQYQNPLSSISLFATHPELPMLALIMILFVMVGYFFLRTQLGYACAVFGNNSRFFEHYGISTNYVVLTGVSLANGLAGLAGYFVAQSSGYVDMHAGHGMALFCITALILGKALSGTRAFFAIRVPIIGTLGYFAIIQILLAIGFNQKYFTMLQACFVLSILMYNYRYKGRSAMADHLGV